MNTVLTLKQCLCDLAEQSWALKAELGMYATMHDHDDDDDDDNHHHHHHH